MVDWLGLQQAREESMRRRIAEHLKQCPLCGSLNAIQNDECVTCRWHGTFEHDPLLVGDSFFDLVDRCPELAQAFPEARPRKAPWWVMAKTWYRRTFRRRLNLSV